MYRVGSVVRHVRVMTRRFSTYDMVGEASRKDRNDSVTMRIEMHNLFSPANPEKCLHSLELSAIPTLVSGAGARSSGTISSSVR